MHHKISNNRFAFRVAIRYLFSKKTHNAVNIISIISALGILVVTLALIVILSVFNGFDALLEKMFSCFDPDLEISLVEGKHFEYNDDLQNKIKNIEGVFEVSSIIKESALASYSNRQAPVMVMGVEKNYSKITDVKNFIYDGEFSIDKNDPKKAIIGTGVAYQLGLHTNSFTPLILNSPKRTERINMLRPETSLITERVQISGLFLINQPDYDDHIVMVSLPVARTLFQYKENMVTSIQVKIKPTAKISKIAERIKTLMGDKFQVLNRYEQQKDYFKMTKIEKWVTYLILSFILMVAIFNIIGSLSLLIIEKKEDISTLHTLGATEQTIKKIFLFEGWLIATLGAIVGLFIGIIIILLQQYIGILKMGAGAFIEFYPVKLSIYDIFITFITVITISFFSVLYPVKYIKT